jgi:hypothetical protein
MSRMSDVELAMLELVTNGPVGCLPSQHLPTAKKLLRHGLLMRRDGVWYPTAIGLTAAGRKVH